MCSVGRSAFCGQRSLTLRALVHSAYNIPASGVSRSCRQTAASNYTCCVLLSYVAHSLALSGCCARVPPLCCWLSSCVIVWLGTHSAENSAENDLRALFDDSLLHHPAVAHIDCNPITAANVAKVLRRIQQSRHTTSTPAPHTRRVCHPCADSPACAMCAYGALYPTERSGCSVPTACWTLSLYAMQQTNRCCI